MKRWVEAWRAAFEAHFGERVRSADDSANTRMLRELEKIARGVDYVAPECIRDHAIHPAMSVFHGFAGEVGRVAFSLAKAIEVDEEDRKMRARTPGGAK